MDMKWKVQPLYRPDGEGDGGGDSPPPPPVEGQDPPPPPPVEPPDDKNPPWYVQRIGALTAQKKSADERLQAAEARIRELEARPVNQGLSEDEVEKRAAAKAEALAATKAEALASKKLFDARLVEIGNAGRKEYGQDFNGALQTFQNSLGDLPPKFLEALLETGDQAHRVLVELSKDLDRAAAIMTSSSETKMTAEVLKFAQELGSKRKITPPKVSGAPAPIEPKIGGGAGSGIDPLVKPQSMKDWVAAREAQLKVARR